MSFKAGFVAFVGQPNAGKSQCINKIVGEKIGIVTSKPQTTRQRVVGILRDEEAQVFFVDSPGWIEAEQGLNAFLKEEVEKGLGESDVLVAVLSLDENDPQKLEQIIEKVVAAKKPWIALISKTDLPKRHRIPIIEAMVNNYGVAIVQSSAKLGTQELRQVLLPEIKKLLPEAPAPLEEEDIYTTQSMRDLSAEIVREKCFEFLHQEIPYNLAVQVKSYKEDEGPTVKIYADIILAKASHRIIVLGKGGQTIKTIGMAAREDLEKIIGRKVFLNLFVKVKNQWTKNKSDLEELGYAQL